MKNVWLAYFTRQLYCGSVKWKSMPLRLFL